MTIIVSKLTASNSIPTSGSDVLISTRSNDYFDGGLGNDTIQFKGAIGGVIVNLAQGTAIGDGNDTLLNIENIDGSNFHDILTGDANDNYLSGGGGNDILTGGDGNDQFIFDAAQANGSDTIMDFSPGDEIILKNIPIYSLNTVGKHVANLGYGDVFLGTSSSGSTELYVGIDSILGADLVIRLKGEYTAEDLFFDSVTTEIKNITGTMGNDLLVGTANDDYLEGLGGNDTIDGGSGQDTALFSGLKTDYTIFVDPNTLQVTVTDKMANRDGTDILSGVEKLSFLNETINVPSPNTVPSGSVTITGTATQGQTLTATNTLADIDGIPTSGLGSISYQWQAGGVNISGATGNTLVLGQAQVAQAITVVAKYTDVQGTTESKSSSATGSVANINDLPVGSVAISGTATQGQTLTANNSLTDIDGIPSTGAGAISYQWQAGGVDIAGATGSTLVLVQSQVSKAITVVALLWRRSLCGEPSGGARRR
jgi:Ca2+-binding RTX toxin-like protein